MTDDERERQRQMNRWNGRVSYAAVLGRLRRETGLNRAELATRTGIDEERLKELEEADVDRLTHDETQALAHALGTTWTDIQEEARGRSREMPEGH